MAITDFATLKAAIQKYCVRSDPTFGNCIPDFISLAEDRIFNGVGDARDPLYSEPLRSDEMVTRATVAMTNGEGTVPSTSLGVRTLSRLSDMVGLDPLSVDAFELRLAVPDTGNPRWYTIEGSTIRTAPSGYTGDFRILYYAKPDGITSSNTTNVVLTARPNLYLSATLFEAFTFLRDGESAAGHLARYRSLVSGANRTQKANRRAGKTRSRARIRIGS